MAASNKPQYKSHGAALECLLHIILFSRGESQVPHVLMPQLSAKKKGMSSNRNKRRQKNNYYFIPRKHIFHRVQANYFWKIHLRFCI